MSALDDFFANRNWEDGGDGDLCYIGEADPHEAAAELVTLRKNIESWAYKTVAMVEAVRGTCELQPGDLGYLVEIEEAKALRANLTLCQDLLVDCINQACVKTVKKTGADDRWIHMFITTYESAFQYLVDHGLAEWAENGVDIVNLHAPKEEEK